MPTNRRRMSGRDLEAERLSQNQVVVAVVLVGAALLLCGVAVEHVFQLIGINASFQNVVDWSWILLGVLLIPVLLIGWGRKRMRK